MIVVWRITERCNLACGFCAYDRRLERSRQSADRGTVLAFGSALAAYQRAAGDQVLVSWLGGEPLLWTQLEGLTIPFVRELGLRVSVTTNGTALASGRVCEHILEYYDELTVSVDGLGEAHDRVRGWVGGFAVLRRVVPLLAAGRKRGATPRLRVNVVLMRDNVHEFAQLCLELATWGIDEITFNQLGGNDRPEFWVEHHLLPSDVDRLACDIPMLRERLAACGVTLRGGDRYLERIRSSAEGRRLPVRDCGPGERFLFVGERGLIAPCSFTSDEFGVPISELSGAEDIASLPARFATMRSRRSMPPAVCGDCPSTQVFDKFQSA
ncbi:MAG TPA: radical SAM protein [Gemmatimonadaceae bacterium]